MKDRRHEKKPEDNARARQNVAYGSERLGWAKEKTDVTVKANGGQYVGTDGWENLKRRSTK